MSTQNLTGRQRAALEHLKQAQDLGSTLADYAAAFNLNVKDLYNGRVQLQRKGFWPSRTRRAEPATAELLAVQVVEPAASGTNEEWVCRLRGAGGWLMECRHFPEVSWLAGLSAATKVAA